MTGRAAEGLGSSGSIIKCPCGLRGTGRYLFSGSIGWFGSPVFRLRKLSRYQRANAGGPQDLRVIPSEKFSIPQRYTSLTSFLQFQADLTPLDLGNSQFLPYGVALHADAPILQGAIPAAHGKRKVLSPIRRPYRYLPGYIPGGAATREKPCLPVGIGCIVCLVAVHPFLADRNFAFLVAVFLVRRSAQKCSALRLHRKICAGLRLEAFAFFDAGFQQQFQ